MCLQKLRKQPPYSLIFILFVLHYFRQGGYVFIGVFCLFVCLFICWQDYAKPNQPTVTKFGGDVAHGPLKKPLDWW